MRFVRLFAPIALVAMLAIALTGCGGSADKKTGTTAGSGSDSTATAVSAEVKDSRIVGIWKGKDGDIQFRANGEAVLADGSRVDYAMPTPEKLEMKFQSGTQTYDIQWKSDDEHGARLVGGKDQTFTYYTRQK